MRSLPSRAVLTLSSLYLLAFGLALPILDQKTIIAAALLSPPLVWLSVHDLRHHTIPDTTSVIVALVGLGYNGVLLSGFPVLEMLFAIFVLVAFWFGGEIYYRRTGLEGLGIGDAKLLAAGALCVGIGQFWVMLLLGSVGGIAAIMLSQRGNTLDPKSAVPFGPFLAYSLFLTFLFVGA